MDKSKLIDAFLEQTKTLDKVEKALEIVKTRRSTLVKQLFEGHGKGPHDIGGKLCNIVQKGDTFFFLPLKTNADGTPAKACPTAEELNALVKAITAPMASGDIAKAIGTTPGPKFSELLKHALDQGLIGKTGERAQTRYQPKTAS